MIGIDDTIERRWGHKINARGIYRDPARSSKGHFVKTSGLRWLSAQLLVHVPWAGRIMGLPFLTVLAPSKRFYADKPRAPKTLLDCARQAALQIHRWLPGRRIVIVGDAADLPPSGSSPPSEVISASSPDCASTPIFMPPHRPDVRVADDRRSRESAWPNSIRCCRTPVPFGNATPSHSGMAAPIASSNSLPAPPSGTTRVCPVPIRWLLVRDPLRNSYRRPSSVTNLDAAPGDILQWFVSRWQLEVYVSSG